MKLPEAVNNIARAARANLPVGDMASVDQAAAGLRSMFELQDVPWNNDALNGLILGLTVAPLLDEQTIAVLVATCATAVAGLQP